MLGQEPKSPPSALQWLCCELLLLLCKKKLHPKVNCSNPGTLSLGTDQNRPETSVMAGTTVRFLFWYRLMNTRHHKWMESDFLGKSKPLGFTPLSPLLLFFLSSMLATRPQFRPNYRSIKGFLAKPSFCRVLRPRETRRTLQSECDIISCGDQLRDGLERGDWRERLLLSLPLSLCHWARVPPPWSPHTRPSISKQETVG